ncbi:hypothetical protein GOBAR_DD27585 [Gossypium barbadense]|nr:hypothetical protein GOBAR_DD27585 [Gossypium barbadense]
MALLTFNPLTCLSSSPVRSCSTSLPIVVLPISRLRVNRIDDHCSKCSIGTQFVPSKKRSVMTVKASSASTDGEEQVPAESKKEDLPVGTTSFRIKDAADGGAEDEDEDGEEDKAS